MSELIDRQAALDVLCDACGNCACPKGKIPRCSYYEKMQAIPAASPWHRVEETPKKDGWYMLCFLSRWRDGNWWIPNFPDYWMDATPPKEDE